MPGANKEVIINGKPVRLLNLDQPDLADPFIVGWQLREQLIAARMEASLAAAKQGLTSVQLRTKTDPRTVDAIHVIGKFTKRGESIGRIGKAVDQPTLVSTLVYAIGKIKPGMFYWIQPGDNSDQKLRTDLFRQFIPNLLTPGDTSEDDLAKVQKDKATLFERGYPINYATLLRSFLQNPAIPGITSLYRRIKPDEAQAAFYQAFPITPIGGSLPESLAVIPDQSLQAFFVVDSFSKLQNRKQPALVEQLLRTLQPGGKLLFRDTPRGQAAIEYYADQVAYSELFRRDLRDLNDPSVWMLYTRKQIPEAAYSFPPSPPVPEKNEHKLKLLELAEKVYQVLLDSGLTNKSILTDQMIAAARKIIGFSWLAEHKLLGTVIKEFKGDFNKMFTYAVLIASPQVIEPEAHTQPVVSTMAAGAVEIVSAVADVPKKDEVVFGVEMFNNKPRWTLAEITQIVAQQLGQTLNPHKVNSFLKDRRLVAEVRGSEHNSANRKLAAVYIDPSSASVIANVISSNAHELTSKRERKQRF